MANMQSDKKLEETGEEEGQNEDNFFTGTSVCKGKFGKENLPPMFSNEKADQHYTSNYSTEKTTNLEDIHWYPKVKTGPEDPNFSPFDMSPIRPRDVTSVLKNANHKSSPSIVRVPF